MEESNEKIKNVLLVDDDLVTNYVNEIIINQTNLVDKVTVKRNGLEALEYLTTNTAGFYPQPELILLDINMPKMNGLEFLEQYHKLDEIQKSNVVVVMLTNSLNPDDQKICEHYNVNRFIIKPLQKYELMDVITRSFIETNRLKTSI
ncbi:MAG: response regulator [Bacteroidota bacterium]